MAAQSSSLSFASGHRLLDPSAHGLGLLRDLAGRWSADLDLTRLGSLIALAGLAPAAWRLLRGAWHETYGWVQQFFLATVTIPARDPLNRHVMAWVLAHVIEPRRVRALTARTRLHAADAADRAAQLKKTPREVQYLPHFETTWFWHAGALFTVRRSLDVFHAAMGDPAYDGIGGEELTIGCLGRSTEPAKRLIQTCREYADAQAQYFIIIYARDRYGMSWQPKSRKPIRRLDTVHFDDAVKQELLADIRNMPYRRGYLFYGPPGTGKSSLSTALAGEFGLDLYEVKMPSVAADQDLEQMFQEIPPQCIVLLEDIDAVWADRNASSTSSSSSDAQTQHGGGGGRSGCTLSGLLNVLDGVGSQEGRIVVMTTNKPEHLDSALVRPGRVDMKVFLGNISPRSAEQMFVRMFAPDLHDNLALALLSSSAPSESSSASSVVLGDASDAGSTSTPLLVGEIHRLAADFARHIPDDTFTPSQLQGFFQLYLDSAVDAAANIAPWVERELTRRSTDDNIEIVKDKNTK
ncbi:ATPase [Apiospora kogelbergensis]|uniref:ATPase n=1 Tax=Apiospora kogelbergensis TaxID=1337665 RepID=UPI00313120CC